MLTGSLGRRILSARLAAPASASRAILLPVGVSSRAQSTQSAQSTAHSTAQRTAQRTSQRSHSTRPWSSMEEAEMPILRTTKPSPALPDLQKDCWDGYLATGRGCLTLFSLIDSDRSGSVSAAELAFFIDNVGSRGMNPAAQDEVRNAAVDLAISYPEFQAWLIRATKFDERERNANIKAMYDLQPDLGERYRPAVPGGEEEEAGEAAAAEAAAAVSGAPSPSRQDYSWNTTTMSQGLRRMQYAVRGEVVLRADALAAEGKEIVYTNIGNPHALGQDPITFYREVMALCDLPEGSGVGSAAVSGALPADAVRRAREMRDAIGPAGTGAYTNSQGVLDFRQHVADYIAERDGHPAYPANVFLTNGASAGIEMVLSGLISDDRDAVMIPIPQYPIYSALIGRLGARQVGYYLDEDRGWAVSEEELQARWDEGRAEGLSVKALALINPGNPTGQVLSREDLQVICRFCARNGIVLLADEVYQRNIYARGKEFVSAKKVALEDPGCHNLQLVSFHSTSKGFIGECGRRGGYMELHHIDPYVQTQLYKLASAGLCSGVSGQVMTSLMVKPPAPGGESHERFVREEGEIFESLRRRAAILVDGLNGIDGIECNETEGAMYAFPRLTLPRGAWEEASRNNQSVDTLYALSLLEETGICVVPASGFGQKKGRAGFRTTFLPPEETIVRAVDMFKQHHEKFCARYA